MTRNFAKRWADPGGGGREWMASHPPLEQLSKKIYQNIMRGKTSENTWVPKKSRKLTLTISSLDVIFSGKGLHIMSSVLLFLK